MQPAKLYKLTPVPVNKTEEAYTGYLYSSHDTVKKIKANHQIKDELFV
jgi:hypothetical protein